MKSVRNKSGAVQQLDSYIRKTKDPLSQEVKDALNYIDAAQVSALGEQFSKCQLVLREQASTSRAKAALDKLAGMAVPTALLASKGADILGALRDAFEKVSSTVPGLGFEDVLKAIGLPAFANLAHTVVPFLGAVKSGKNAVIGWGKFSCGVIDAVELRRSKVAVREGDSLAALEAILDIVQEEMAFNRAKAGVASAAFGGKVAGIMGDLGTGTTALIGVGETILTILLEFTEYVVQRKKFNKGNKSLAAGPVTKDVFEECPLLGCYYAALQPQSTIVNFELRQFGQPGWMDRYERLSKKASVVRELAFKYGQGVEVRAQGRRGSYGHGGRDPHHHDRRKDVHGHQRQDEPRQGHQRSEQREASTAPVAGKRWPRSIYSIG